MKMLLQLSTIFLCLLRPSELTIITVNYFPPSQTLPTGYIPNPAKAIGSHDLGTSSKLNTEMLCSIKCSHVTECKLHSLDATTGLCMLFSSPEMIHDPSGSASSGVRMKVPNHELDTQSQNVQWRMLLVHQVLGQRKMFNYSNNSRQNVL